MTTYALDTSGTLSANAITAEPHVINTIGQPVPSLLFMDQPLFYATGFSLSYTDVDGATATLVLGDDYSFVFEIDGVAGSNKIYGAVKINNFQLNGTLSASYQTVGGNWRTLQSQILNFLNQNYFSPRQGYVSLKPQPDVLSSDGVTPLTINSAAAITAVQAGTTPGTPILLTPVILALPNSRKLFVEYGLVIDGNGLQKVS